ncbi:hypothetical protein AAFF_G00438770 [Aldrovandia affinis]|uniref:Uncharacterized protein n=1 Tax=Aldrovandia affinis TaxID=143900 RepID=A0AAD7R3D5_9TELE|nr:hypothetical protein AAFF_G00438770 [Aldrovandia affinis]
MSSPLPSGSDLQQASATIMPDFLCANSLLVDVRNRRLVNAETFATLPGSPSSTGTSKLSSALSSADMFQRLLMDFPDLTTPTFSSAAVKHGVDHFIATTGPPVHARARRLDPQKLAVAKAEFDSMERLGIVREVQQSLGLTPPLGSENRGVAPLRDYRRLNDATTPDRYPIPAARLMLPLYAALKGLQQSNW